jgi:hypothetical protein
MNLMSSAKILEIITVIGAAALFSPPGFAQTAPATAGLPPLELGQAPQAPATVSGLPGGGARPLEVTGGFNVNADSREQVREFYNAIYPASDGVAMNSTAVTASCTPGTDSTAFQNATLRRINWFRALGGVPAAITFDAGESTQDQAAALMMSANNTLQHVGIPPTWSCFTIAGTNAAANSNLALGSDGADAITGYIQDPGGNNYEVGHRRWILYPQTQVMAAGDVPVQGGYNAANATWVFDANYGGPRPATSKPYVAWPPEGFVPYSLVFPQWSFALSNADFSAATVSMTSNGSPVSVSLQPYVAGYGENTLVWVPMGLDPTSASTTFPFSGTDTLYSVTVTNIKVGASTTGFSYNVTLFDPAVPGSDYVATDVSGTSAPYLNTGNPYTCVPIANPNTTGYLWLAAQTTNGNLTDTAGGGLVNFTMSPAPTYPVITNPPTGSGKCFHLCHASPVSQFLQLNEMLLPAANTTVSFKDFLGYATTDESAHVQVSVDGGANWQDLFAEAGNNGQTDSAFVNRSLSLSNFVGQLTLLRFTYNFTSGSYFTGSDPIEGWCLENIVVTNAPQVVGLATNATASTNFTFTPTQTGNYALAAAPVLFTQYPLGWGPLKQVTASMNPNTGIVLGQPVLTNKQVWLNFTVSGAAGTFHLLQTTNLTARWTTNSTATFTTNVPGSSYRYAATNDASLRFYRVQTP